MGVCICSMFCCTLLYVHSSIAIILMGKRELAALLNLSSWCLVMVERLFLAVPRGCLLFVIVVFPDHAHLLFMEQTQIVQEPAILLIKWLRPKGLKVCSYEEKYAELKNQTLKKLAGSQKCYAQWNIPGVGNFSN